jgi:hypothetical protein
MLNPMLNTFLQQNTTNGSNIRTVHLEDLVDSFEMNNIISEMIGNVNHGVNDIDNSLSTVDISEVLKVDQKVCSICLEKFENIENCVIKRTTCKHYFCEACIMTWLRDNRTCPLCCFDFNDSECI